MDLIDHLRSIAARVDNLLDHTQTEEATKTAFVLPFINALGYNVFDPTEVIPEYTADVGSKKGERVDYAIMKNGKPIMVFECKQVASELTDENASQLYRYFTSTDTRFGVLTNGVIYRFYSDLDQPNRMDERPFFEFNILNFSPHTVDELKRFTKQSFDLTGTIEAATDLKYTKEIKRVLADQTRQPYSDFVLFMISQVYKGRRTKAVREQFADLTKRAFDQFINDRINDRLKSALEREQSSDPAPVEEATDEESPAVAEDDSGVVTTIEEIEGYNVVKAILRDMVDAKRIVMRDQKSFCAVLLDDNNRKNICRLWFNSAEKQVGIIDASGQRIRRSIDTIDDIFGLSEHASRGATPQKRACGSGSAPCWRRTETATRAR